MQRVLVGRFLFITGGGVGADMTIDLLETVSLLEAIASVH
jgi:hypothetical protein